MNVNVFAKRLLPSFESRLLVRRLLSLPRDTFEAFTGRRDPLIPPHGLWFVGGEQDYEAVNEEFLRYFVDLGGLQPTHRILDVGCGPGVLAARLTRFVEPPGSYCGIDIVKAGIRWAQTKISPRYPNFSFAQVDVFNKHYNPKGKIRPVDFRFPYNDAAFDFVILKSVLTHLLPDTIRQYLDEVRRVLKPAGKCLVTLFLLNPESAASIEQGRSSIALTQEFEGCRVVDPKFPETAIAIPEHQFISWCQDSGLQVRAPIYFGRWCGRSQYLSYQDVVLLELHQDGGLEDPV